MPQSLPDLSRLPDAQIDALASAADQIGIERDQTERTIKSLLEAGKDDEALALMRKHLNVKESDSQHRTGLSDESLAVLVRGLAEQEEKLLQELCDAVLNDDASTAKHLVKRLRG